MRPRAIECVKGCTDFSEEKRWRARSGAPDRRGSYRASVGGDFNGKCDGTVYRVARVGMQRHMAYSGKGTEAFRITMPAVGRIAIGVWRDRLQCAPTADDNLEIALGGGIQIRHEARRNQHTHQYGKDAERNGEFSP